MTHTWARWMIGVALLAVNACAHDGAGPVPGASVSPIRNQHDTLIREARGEAERLRSELASAKIAGAKLTADLRALRQEAERLRARETELGTQVQQLREEVAALQRERDTLRRRTAELQAQSTALPVVHQLADQLNAQQALLERLSDAVKAIATDIRTMKKDVAQAQSVVLRRSIPSGDVPGVNGQEPASPAIGVQTVIVQPRDTLWRIARDHGVSVEHLQQLNGLTSSLIRVGQILKVPIRQRAGAKTSGATQPTSDSPPVRRDAATVEASKLNSANAKTLSPPAHDHPNTE